MHSPIAAAARTGDAAYDFDPLFGRVRRIVGAADLGLCHLETPLSRDNLDLSYYPRFSVPRELAPGLARAGFDYCSTASNHAVDAGFEGVRATLDALDRAGIAHDGTARDRREARRPAYLEVAGVRIALLSYTYGLNGLVLPASVSWGVNTIDTRRILADARRVRRHAEFVIVSLHWGVEYVAEPTPDQRRLARRLTRSGLVDLIVGHHAHVVQPIDRVHGRTVLYGLGNFVSSQSSACCRVETQDGVVVHLRVRESGQRFRVTRIRYTPTWVDHDPYRVVPVGRALRGGDALLRASALRTRRALGMLGVRARVYGP